MKKRRQLSEPDADGPGCLGCLFYAILFFALLGVLLRVMAWAVK